MNWYKKSQQQISRQVVKDAIFKWGFAVGTALGYYSNPGSLTKGLVTLHQNEFLFKFNEISKYAKQRFTTLQAAASPMNDAQFDRNIPIFIRELVSINNYIKQYFTYFGIADRGQGLINFDKMVSQWVGI